MFNIIRVIIIPGVEENEIRRTFKKEGLSSSEISELLYRINTENKMTKRK